MTNRCTPKGTIFLYVFFFFSESVSSDCLLCAIKLQMVDGVLSNAWDRLFQTTYSITFLCSHIIYCNTDSVFCFVNWMSVLNCMPFSDDSVLWQVFYVQTYFLKLFFFCVCVCVFIRFYNGCVCIMIIFVLMLF